MDPDLMSKALKSVLGEGYETQSRTTGVNRTSTPSPHDFLQGRVNKSSPVGGDMHVPTTMGADKPKKRAKLKPVEYVGKAERTPEQKAKRLDTQSRVSQKLLAAGATGGVLSLPALAAHTKNEMRRGGMLKPKGPGSAWDKAGVGERLKMVDAPKAPAKGVLKPVAEVLKKPKVGAGLAAGAAGLEMAGLAGDFLGHHTIKEQRKAKKTAVLKALDPTPTEDVITFSKIDEDKHQVFGWFSVSKKDGVEVIDLQGDHIPIEETEASAYRYMLESRKGGNQHARVTKNFGMGEIARGDEPLHVADVIESMVFTPDKIEKMGLPADFPQGWWGGLQVHDEETWGQIKRRERTGFSIHGKGRREALVSKVHSAEYETRKEKAKDISLGVAGATAAGAGGGSAVVPLAAKKGFLNPVKAEALSGRMKTVGAIVGGTAGVYGGLHAAHQAAKTPAVREMPNKAKAKVKSAVGIKKAWSPTVDRQSSEYRRQRRAKGYQVGGTTAAVGGGLTAGAAHLSRVGHAELGAQAGGRAAAIKVPGTAEVDRRVAVSRGARRAGDQYAIERRRPVNVKARGESARKAESKIRSNFARERGNALRAKDVNLASAAQHAKGAARATKVRNRAGLIGAVGAGVAGLVSHKRKGSWRPYPGVR